MPNTGFKNKLLKILQSGQSITIDASSLSSSEIVELCGQVGKSQKLTVKNAGILRDSVLDEMCSAAYFSSIIFDFSAPRTID